MPRPLRTDAPGTVHHVIVRGVEKRTIFLDDADREDFLSRLDRLVGELGFQCHAWALIPNHAHLVLRREGKPLAVLMARLGTGYAQRFNRRYDRVGHLFQGRYRSGLVADESGLARAVAYVLGNPVRHGMVSLDALARFAWSGYGAVVGARPPRRFENADATLALLGADRVGLRDRLQARLLDAEVAEVALEPDALDRLDGLIAETCRRHGISPSVLRTKQREAVIARAEISARSVRELGLRAADVARALGVSDTAIHRALLRAR